MTPSPTTSPVGRCKVDADCPQDGICFSGARSSWVRDAYDSMDAAFCDCPRTLLHTGFPSCDMPTPAYYAEVAFHTFELVLLAFILLASLVLFVRHVRRRGWRYGWNIVCVVLGLASICHIVGIGLLTACSDPVLGCLIIIDDGSKQCRFYIPMTVFVLLGLVLTLLGLGQSAMTWWELVQRIEFKVTLARVRKKKKMKTGKQLEEERMYMRAAFVLLQAGYLLVMVCAVALQDFHLALIATIPYVLILMTGLYFGGESLSGLMAKLGADSTDKLEMLRLIRTTTRVLSPIALIGLGLLIAASLLLSQSGGLRYEPDFFDRPGAICLLLAQLLLIVGLFVLVLHLIWRDRQAKLHQIQRQREAMARLEQLRMSSTAATMQLDSTVVSAVL